MYNKVVLVGNLTRDIEMKHSSNSTVIAKSAIATSRKFTGQNNEKKEEVCFVDITFFGRTGEVASQYLRKGSKLLIEGRLSFEQWTDQNGQKQSKHSVIVETMQMMDTKSSSVLENTDSSIQSNTTMTKMPKQDTYNSSTSEITEEDIPF
jgi:single-strand DNA-binding protein